MKQLVEIEESVYSKLLGRAKEAGLCSVESLLEEISKKFSSGCIATEKVSDRLATAISA